MTRTEPRATNSEADRHPLAVRGRVLLSSSHVSSLSGLRLTRPPPPAGGSGHSVTNFKLIPGDGGPGGLWLGTAAKKKRPLAP